MQMTLKYNKTTLKKLEAILTDSEYTVRYERGQFKSGYCLLRNKKIVIINRFFDIKGRVSSLLEVMQDVELIEEKISEQGKQLLQTLEKSYSEELH